MCPKQIGGSALRAEAGRTGARKDPACQTLVGGFAWQVSQGVASRRLMPRVVDLPEPWEAQDVPRVQAAHRPEGAGCVRRQAVAWARLAQCESMVKGGPRRFALVELLTYSSGASSAIQGSVGAPSPMSPRLPPRPPRTRRSSRGARRGNELVDSSPQPVVREVSGR